MGWRLTDPVEVVRAVYEAFSRRGGDAITVKTLHVHRVRDGKIVESWLNPLDEASVDEWWTRNVGRPPLMDDQA